MTVVINTERSFGEIIPYGFAVSVTGRGLVQSGTYLGQLFGMTDLTRPGFERQPNTSGICSHSMSGSGNWGYWGLQWTRRKRNRIQIACCMILAGECLYLVFCILDTLQHLFQQSE